MIMRHARAVAIGLALAAGSIATTVPDQAEATSLAELSIEQITDASTYIVTGTVTEVWTEVDDKDWVWTRARLAVDTVYKGPDAPQELIIDTIGGVTPDGRTTIVHGAARFSEGEELVAFLDTIKHGERLTPVGMFLGKYTVRRAAGEDRQHVMRWHGKALETFDARFLPTPAVESRVYLDDLLSQVESRLVVGWDGQPIAGISATKLETVNAPERRIRR